MKIENYISNYKKGIEESCCECDACKRNLTLIQITESCVLSLQRIAGGSLCATETEMQMEALTTLELDVDDYF